MELLVLGHAGARVVVFPTSQGRFYEWEDRGMIDALGDHLRNGWIQLYCVDSVDAEAVEIDWEFAGDLRGVGVNGAQSSGVTLALIHQGAVNSASRKIPPVKRISRSKSSWVSIVRSIVLLF